MDSDGGAFGKGVPVDGQRFRSRRHDLVPEYEGMLDDEGPVATPPRVRDVRSAQPDILGGNQYLVGETEGWGNL